MSNNADGLRKDRWWHEDTENVIIRSVGSNQVWFTTENGVDYRRNRTEFLNTFSRGKYIAPLIKEEQVNPTLANLVVGSVWMHPNGVKRIVTRIVGITVYYVTDQSDSEFSMTSSSFVSLSTFHSFDAKLAVEPGSTWLAKTDKMVVSVDDVKDNGNVVFHSAKRFYTYSIEKFLNFFEKSTLHTSAIGAPKEEVENGSVAEKDIPGLVLEKVETGIKDVFEELKLLKEENKQLKDLLLNSYMFLSQRPKGYSAHMSKLKSMFVN